ncbi:2-aminoethanethiol dioxygenase [Amphibalanus amphitrite]|uniref:2-aminoethanethiol dioxygenase n=2 Tax=Amphibalanus amphitrite TaxID=1232801 RepID=A0A6A4VYD7_AMPAM|nr:2-aminoethanethiol dioxygenase [Amphibalanus amphitrite]
MVCGRRVACCGRRQTVGWPDGGGEPRCTPSRRLPPSPPGGCMSTASARGGDSDVVASPAPPGSLAMAAPGQFLIQRVVRMAVDVFRSTPQGTAAFREGLSQLTQLVHQLTPQDVAFDPNWVRDRRPFTQDRNIMPMTYVRLCENEYISIGIFILKNGFTLPMHDHPNMHGVLKVLHGQLQMQSFTPRRAPQSGILNGGDSAAATAQWDVRQTRLGTIYHTAKELPRFMGPADGPALLTPEQGNIHQICAVDGPVAFLDILAPPYDEHEHIYHTFRELDPVRLHQLTNGELSSEGWLIRVRDNPFPSDSAKYRGPRVDDIG